MKKKLEFFNVSSKKNIIFGFNNFILEENKKIFGNVFISSKGQ
jgi:hypothetical protein